MMEEMRVIGEMIGEMMGEMMGETVVSILI